MLDNPWMGAIWASMELVTLGHTNRAHDAIGIARAAEAWRRREEHKQREAEAKAARVHAKAKGR